MQCVVDLPAPGGHMLAATLAAFAVLSFLCFIPASITRSRARWWLLCASLLLVGIAVQSFHVSSVLNRSQIIVAEQGIVIQAGMDQVELALDAPRWTGIRQRPPADMRADAPNPQNGVGWYHTPAGERLFVASGSQPARVATAAGFDLVLDWNTVVDVESCVVQIQTQQRNATLGF